MPRVIAAVGVDLGATWLRAVGVDAGGRVARRARLPAVEPGALASALAPLLRRWRAVRPRLCVGSTRVWTPDRRAAIRASLARLGSRVTVLSDLELAWRAHHGGGSGVLVLAGTGSVAYGGDLRGHRSRAGGLGPLLGDEGSAFWMGREWLKLRPEAEALRVAHRPDAIRAVASRARKVLSADDAASRRIVRGALAALGAQARRAASRLHFGGRIPVSLHGGLFRDEAFRRAFLRMLGRRWEPVGKGRLAEDAAALYALRGIW